MPRKRLPLSGIHALGKILLVVERFLFQILTPKLIHFSFSVKKARLQGSIGKKLYIKANLTAHF